MVRVGFLRTLCENNLDCGPNLNQKDSEYNTPYVNARKLVRQEPGSAQKEADLVGEIISVGEPSAISGDIVDLGRRWD